MLKQLNEYFDHYTIQARFMPVFFALLPFVLSMLAWYPNAKSLAGGAVTVLISFGVMTLLSTLVSNIGNKCQKKLFSSWGGAPTTLILRHSNEIVDKYTKQRYHSWISARIEGLELPSHAEEMKNTVDADLKYQSATNYLREFTRDKEKHPTVYRDNVAFGFSRNLFAIRNAGIVISLFSILINIVMIWPVMNVNSDAGATNKLDHYLFGLGAGFISIISFLVFLTIVNEKFVKGRAFRYAKSLLESCELN